jgi:hypothetical protein
VLRLLVANVLLSSPILVVLLMDELLSSETSFITIATRHRNPEDGILHSLSFIVLYALGGHDGFQNYHNLQEGQVV